MSAFGQALGSSLVAEKRRSKSDGGVSVVHGLYSLTAGLDYPD